MKVLITAGPTYEKIDPVRFIGNYSTGKMGFALAEYCANKGFEVILISGPTQLELKNQNIVRYNVESAQQMYEAVMQFFKESNLAIFCAAVADFTPTHYNDKKIKRKSDNLSIQLKPTKDIAKEAGEIKTERQITVGFALETNDEQNNALEKMRRKNLDMIVLNSLNDKGSGFGFDTNKVTIITKKGEKTDLPLLSKTEVAAKIVDIAINKV